jgi:phosphohistidine phosphatase
LKVFLLRHAKSDWSQGLNDHDRPLNQRGRKAAEDLPSILQLMRIEPDIIYVSTAIRAQETVSFLSKEQREKTFIKKELYPGSAIDYINALAETSNKCLSAMIVAHNPGLEELVAKLTSERLLVSMPTACMAIIDFPFDDWKRIAQGSHGVLKALLPIKHLQALS